MNPRDSSSAATLEEAADAFMRLRPRLFGIAYRVLGSVTEAEDVVQEVWVRWQNTDRGAVVAPAPFLTKVTTRLSVNVARSARVRRETYAGPWLPEPVDTGVDPQVGAERGEALELAVLLVMEKLNPVERAAYVLREAFDYSYDQIADMLQLSPANTRQIVSRARRRLATERRRTVGTAEHRRLLEAFLAAARNGDTASLENLLTADVVSYADGNGMRGVALVPVATAGRVARMTALLPRFIPGGEFHVVEVNGRPGVLIGKDGNAAALVVISADQEGIHTLLWHMTPDKLRAYERSREYRT
ncbi:RNA polymerase sigma-70 factor [Streptomyces sp. NPDC002309]